MKLMVYEEQQRIYIPRGMLIGAAVAIAVTIVAATIGGSHTPPRAARMLATRTLSFNDAPDGAVLVSDATTGAPVARLAPGTNGFIRSTLRAMAHEGHAAHAAAVHPFVLSAFEDGRLTLDDPTTGERLDLEAFGTLNAAAFAALLTRDTGGARK
jgi:putative photosynthetic complex assembly protein